MGPQVVRVFSIENLFKEIGDYGMFVLCCVFGALLSERSPHLKRQVNIVFLLHIINNTRVSLHISSYCLLFLVILQLYSLYTWLCFNFKG
jgi:hypothetical protein